MKSVAVVALALLDGVAAFQAPAARSPTKVSKVSMFKEGDIGVTPPLGVWDPLGLISKRDMRRYEIMEIKHGRAAMLGFIHTVLIEAGARWPGYISPSSGAPPPPRYRPRARVPPPRPGRALWPCPQSRAHPAPLLLSPPGLKFKDVPAGLLASLEAVPTAGWLQIMLVTCMAETGAGNVQEFSTQGGLFGSPQTVDKAPGDIGGDVWYRYDDPEAKAFKLNAERNNGRAAMLGITGCLIHELLGVDALYPTGGLAGGAPPTILT